MFLINTRTLKLGETTSLAIGVNLAPFGGGPVHAQVNKAELGVGGFLNEYACLTRIDEDTGVEDLGVEDEQSIVSIGPGVSFNTALLCNEYDSEENTQSEAIALGAGFGLSF